MEAMGMKTTPEEKIYQLFAGLPSDFQPVVANIQIADITDFNIVVSRVRDFGIMYEAKQEQANYAGTRSKSNNTNNNNSKFTGKCYRCIQVGHRANQCHLNKQQGNNPQCPYCKKTNHKAADCYYKPKTEQVNMIALVTDTVTSVLKQMNIIRTRNKLIWLHNKPLRCHNQHQTIQEKHGVLC